MLRLAPQLVGDYKAAKPVAQGMAFSPAAQGWITRERTTPGHIGSPHLATVEKGEHLFRTFAQGVVSFLERVAVKSAPSLRRGLQTKQPKSRL